MLTRSTKSVRSIRSIKSSDDAGTQAIEDVIPSFEFEELLPYICKKFTCDFELFVKKLYARDDFYRYMKMDVPVKYKRMGTMVTPRSAQQRQKLQFKLAESGVEDTNLEPVPENDPNFITISGLYDNCKNLVEIFIFNQVRIPRLLMQAILIITPIYENVTKFTIRNCKMDVYTIYELNKLVPAMFLTDICLDDSFLPEANYAILLEKESTLRQLSLCRCYINDEVCEQIASKLRYPAPAENNLLILNLSGNQIQDKGAKHIGEMLRTNRHLRYLNIAGNHIGDDGARQIFDTLVEFPLSYDEMVEKRRRLFNYLKRKRELLKEMMADGGPVSENTDSVKSGRKKSALVVNNLKLRRSSKTRKEMSKEKRKVSSESNRDHVLEKAEMLVVQFLGKVQGPFNPDQLINKNKWLYSVGNFVLSYLNLSYNNLTYFSVKKALEVMLYQRCTENGLFKVVLEGNLLPKICPEYVEISEFINKKLNVSALKSATTVSSRKKSSIRPSSAGLSGRK